ncbi:WLM domain-containing protein [Schizophyllum fasciatum]
MAPIPLLSASTDSYVRSITHLKDQPRGEEALDVLKHVAALAKPIMRKRNWHLPTLGEFLPDDPNLLGINVNRGHQIFLRLRPAVRPATFYDVEFVMGTLLHELAHNHRGPHDEVFYAYLDGLENEYAALRRSGYAGEGFYSRGRTLGGRPGARLGGVPRERVGRRLGVGSSAGVGRGAGRLGVSAVALGGRPGAGSANAGGGPGRVLGGTAGLGAPDKRRAAEAAEKRRQGARVLDGQLSTPTSARAPLSPREAAAQAAIRRARDAQACASAAQGQAQREAQKATQASEIIDLTLEDDDFGVNGDYTFELDKNDTLEIDEDDVMIVDENGAGPSRPVRRPGLEADDDDDDIVIVYDGTAQRAGDKNTETMKEQYPTPESPQGTGSAAPSPWTCGICTLYNDDDAAQCEACAALRPVASAAGHWTCLRCAETPIPSDLWSCGFCGYVKTAS